MRLFIAIEFSDELKKSLYNTVQALEASSLRGNFTRLENLHLTLVFIGETDRVNDIKQGMDKVKGQPFSLSIGGFGKFPRGGRNIYWIGVSTNNSLNNIYNQLYKELLSIGFQLESREYRPHLTLGREVALKETFDEKAFEKNIPPMNMEVKKISLMKSERVDGKLLYSAIYEKKL